ncbi:MAG: MarR family transcriptional regulator [Ruminococcaceae bacterium]|nr:MarR family transcriptional regulator [Oscillospiraceae bacterium]
MEKNYEALKLENQVSFPLYACAKEVVKIYRNYLETLNLTYTQYITMLVLWEEEKINVKELGEKLYLDSGTLTPVLKSLETKGFVKRYRYDKDERVLLVEATQQGLELRETAAEIPQSLDCCINLGAGEAQNFYNTLQKILSHLKGEED